ncbi:DUF4190 domain-containing protein [Streptomyces sp. NPDC092370]|uniref:DUF4190 domain-containing protein n=1 Tax=Streptomyces sp. NPDC092370 TaxID=3366016 RepID=UPI00382A3B66
MTVRQPPKPLRRRQPADQPDGEAERDPVPPAADPAHAPAPDPRVAPGSRWGRPRRGKIQRPGQSGRGTAIAGVVLSAVGIVLWAVVLSTGAVSQG